MNRLFKKISVALAGLAMAVGAGVALGNSKPAVEAKAVVQSNIFRRITALNQLSDGDEIIFVNQAETYACGTTQNKNNRATVAISTTSHDHTYSTNSNVQVFVVKINAQGKFGFHDGNGYLYSVDDKNNYLRTNDTAASTAPSGDFAWTLAIDEEGYFITATNVTHTDYSLQFYSTTLFSQYKTNQTKPFIYRNTGQIGAPTLSSMAVTTAPATTMYTEGATFDPTGMVITGTFSDSSQSVIANNNIVWANNGVLHAGVTSISGSYENVNVTVNGLTVNQLSPTSLQTIYETAMALGEGHSDDTLYRFSGVITAISGSSVYMQDVTGGYPFCAYGSALSKASQVGKKLTVVCSLKNYFSMAENNGNVFDYSVSENEGAAVEASNINTYSGYIGARKGLYMNLSGLTVTKAINPTQATALTSVDTLAFGEDAITYYVPSDCMTEEMAGLLGNFKANDIVDLNGVIRFKNNGRDGVDFVSSTTVSGGTPASSITISSETSLSIPRYQTSQIVASVNAEATDQRITYASNNNAVATVSDTGLITAVAQGEATITVASLSTPSVNASVTVTVTAREMVANAYNKVYSANEIESGGSYIIVYESNSTSGYVFNGYDRNSDAAVAVTIGGNTDVIVPNAQIDEGAITISTMEGGYSLRVTASNKTNGEKYMSGTKDSNIINFDAGASPNTITIADGVATITSNTSFIQYNSGKRFRYYKAGTTSQSDVSLYKYVGGELSKEAFATYFRNSTTSVCGLESTGADHSASLDRFWECLSAKFAALSGADRGDLANVVSVEGGTAIEDAIACYDHILQRYGTATLNDFIGRIASGKLVLNANGSSAAPLGSANGNAALPIVIAVALSAVVTGGLFFALRKRKER